MDILTQKQTTVLPTKLGEIEVQIPSLQKKLDIERRRSFYAGGLTVISQNGAELADMFARMDVVMTKCPSLTRVKNDPTSWDYDGLYDEDALRDAFQKVEEWQNSFRRDVAGEQAQMGKN
ncbi:hypothetical protein SD70_02535 [Gordoniibacillus kamchatkensis]|uniref:Phage protein n=1 Tax=Gordoniibacillus kamchatkensis TaxID=1590651 RepID=A0ABR5AM98_9BACL|nr:hypothetical protein [Paenibacillus sp. VKM B-2647]KIL42080.1 hypothetical protein SD70_02535 [Paenibacillus sp. VKM B-2647]